MSGDVSRAFYSPAPGLVALGDGLVLVGGGPVYVHHDVNVGTVGTTTSTTAFAEHLSTTKLLDAGTWDVLTELVAVCTHNTASGFVVSRLSHPLLGPTKDDAVGSAFERLTLVSFVRGEVVSDGVTPTVFRAEYRAGTAGTAFARNASILATCTRKS